MLEASDYISTKSSPGFCPLEARLKIHKTKIISLLTEQEWTKAPKLKATLEVNSLLKCSFLFGVLPRQVSTAFN